MIDHPLHLLGVAAYGLLSLVALGFFVVRIRQRPVNAQQRLSRWLLLSMGIGLGCWAVDEWRRAAEWPHAPAAPTVLHGIGFSFISASILALFWSSLYPQQRVESVESEWN